MITLGLLAALYATAPYAAAQERGGVRAYNQPNSFATLDAINANRDCRQPAISVTVGVNKATQFDSSAQQRLGSSGGRGGPGGMAEWCHPLVSTSVVAGANLALGGRSSAGQTIDQQAPRGVLANNQYTRTYNLSYGPRSIAGQRLSNQIGR